MIGKLVGAILGLLLFRSPWGLLIGLVIGHFYDHSMAARRGHTPAEALEIGVRFFKATFEVMGQIAKVDGRVSENEVRVARLIMQSMRLTEAQVQSAIEHFTAGKRADFPLESRLAALAEQLRGRADLARAFVQIQLQSAIGAGDVGAEKRQALWRVANALGVTQQPISSAAVAASGFQSATRPCSESSATSAAPIASSTSESFSE